MLHDIFVVILFTASLSYSYGQFVCRPNFVKRKCDRILANNPNFYNRNDGRVRYNNVFSNWFIQCKASPIVCQPCYSDNTITLHYSNRCDQCIYSTVGNDPKLCYNTIPGPTLPPSQNVCDRSLVKFFCSFVVQCTGEAPFYHPNAATRIAFCQCGQSGKAICQRTGVDTAWQDGIGIVHYPANADFATFNDELTEVLTNFIYNIVIPPQP